MELEHFTDTPLIAVLPREQGEDNLMYGKPTGLWVSVKGDQDWREWNEAESFRDLSKQRCYHVRLASDANVLFIANGWELDAFHKGYARPLELGSYRQEKIDWRDVARDYDGIIIAPYQWTHRLEGPISAWYYGWDCASGCIWNPRAVSTFESVLLASQSGDAA